MKGSRQRIDQMLVDRGLAESRAKAQALILAGSVLANGQKVSKPGHAVAADTSLELLHQLPFVSRGGLKLDAALTHFGIDVTGKVCIDIGATGGVLSNSVFFAFDEEFYTKRYSPTPPLKRLMYRRATAGLSGTTALRRNFS